MGNENPAQALDAILRCFRKGGIAIAVKTEHGSSSRHLEATREILIDAGFDAIEADRILDVMNELAYTSIAQAAAAGLRVPDLGRRR